MLEITDTLVTSECSTLFARPFGLDFWARTDAKTSNDNRKTTDGLDRKYMHT
jgi:hypothetical protein